MFSLSRAQSFPAFYQAAAKLESRIAYLQQTAERYRVTKAKEYLNRANNKLDDAKSFLSPPFPKINDAWSAYRKAKSLTDMAAKILLVKPALQAGAEMDRLLLQAETLAQSSNKAEARYMLTRARSFRFKSETAFRNSRYIKAREYYRIALFFVNKSIKLARGAAGNDSVQSYQQLLEDITNLYSDLSTAAASDAALNKLLQKAQNALNRARQAYELGNRRQALLQLQICERLLYRAADLNQQSGQGRVERLASNLSSLEQYISGIEADLQAGSSGQSLRLLHKAEAFLKAARRDFENGAYKKAESKIALAQRMAAKALRLSGAATPASGADIERRIAEIRHLISLQKEKAPSANEDLMRLFHQKARRLLNSAEKDFQSGKTKIAYQKTKTALHLVNRLESVLSANQVIKQTAPRLLTRLQQMEQALQVLEQNTNAGSGSAVLLPLLKELSEKARIAIDNDNLVMAQAILDFMQGRINNLMKTEAH